ncbi:UDP-N-acetylmuramoyl-tripeptide--D-alanyl-D-alanine ligase [Anaplasma capra]|uniref:UDP-N-acetylmuramoyl-tripeptide--D-alanyl-D- alanine ligase n=1 Tax=Anaplasma capra TaxID=1562740 RepID=UPI0021D5DB48|nr:UDP-N-acetylmuramoyl-tripeptide--D-alanyl-D-alanine ligase [Anaplasma capra]MCU7612013.1 UDP-N-acetylmuramoyl-tripeptide--D-alanyl-D-alanine ligase [Anaplasma capra]
MSFGLMWDSKSVEAAASGLCRGGDWVSPGRISIDTRSLNPGDVFLAIRGANFDGHCFVREAFDRGAVAAVVSRESASTADYGPVIVVEDTLQALHDIAAFRMKNVHAKVVAITGSAGKTTTKYMLCRVLSKFGKVHYNEANYNNLIGMPLYAANTPADAEFVVMEMGMNAPKEIDTLSRIARPDVAVITNVGPAHLEFFGSIEGILAAKLEIFNHVKSCAAAVINFDSAYYGEMRAAAERYCSNVISFGAGAGAGVQILRGDKQECSPTVNVKYLNRELHLSLKNCSRHLVYSAAVAVAVGCIFALDLGQVGYALEGFAPIDGRGKVHITTFKGREIVLIDDAYNANPLSMVVAIENLSALEHAQICRKVAVLGDMLELGSSSGSYHRSLLGHIARSNIDLVYTVGNHMLELHNVLPKRLRGRHFADYSEALKRLERVVRPGDCILVKGSFATKLSLVVRRILEHQEHATQRSSKTVCMHPG